MVVGCTWRVLVQLNEVLVVTRNYEGRQCIALLIFSLGTIFCLVLRSLFIVRLLSNLAKEVCVWCIAIRF